MKFEDLKLRWKKDDGSGEETDDITLWVNGNPSRICISGAIAGDYGVLFIGDRKVEIGDTRTELKKTCLENYKEAILEEARAYGVEASEDEDEEDDEEE